MYRSELEVDRLAVYNKIVENLLIEKVGESFMYKNGNHTQFSETTKSK